MGPLVSKNNSTGCWVSWKRGRQGAKTVMGGNRLGDHGYFVEPTVLTKRAQE